MSVIEVGKIRIIRNSVNGVEVFHDYYNAGEKEIKYVIFTYVPYNSVKDVVTCTVSGKTEASGELTGPISPKTKSYVSWKSMWYNPTVISAVITQIRIKYMDNTEETVDGKDVLFMEDKNSVYYCKVGRIEKIRAELQKNWSSGGRDGFSLDSLSDLKQDEEAWLAVFDNVKMYYSTGYEIGDYIEKECGSNENLMKKAIFIWKDSIVQQQKFYNTSFARKNPDFPQKYAAKIQTSDPSYVLPKGNANIVGKLIGKIVSLIEKVMGK